MEETFKVKELTLNNSFEVIELSGNYMDNGDPFTLNLITSKGEQL